MLCRSFWLVGLGIASAASGAPQAGQHTDDERQPQAPTWRRAELASGLRLVLATSSQAERTALCAGLAVQPLGRDGEPSIAALVELELRIEALAVEQQRATSAGSDWRAFNRVEGDTTTLCLSVPRRDFDGALAALLELSKPIAATHDDCARATTQWQEHRGLAKLAQQDADSAQVQTLAWLGSGSPQTLAFALRQVSQTACESWQLAPAAGPIPTTLAISGDFDPAALEAEIRGRRSSPQSLRNARVQPLKSAATTTIPVHTYPRFVRLRTSEPVDSSVIMGWPVARAGEREELAARVTAAVIEQRLNRSLNSQARHATARVVWLSGYGTFEVEIRPTRAEELASTEERVLAVVDQLRTTHVSSTDFESAFAQAVSPAPVSGERELDRALQMSQRALVGWNSRTVTPTENYLKPTELALWTGRLLTRSNIAEVFVDSVASRQRAGTRAEGQRPKGVMYAIKPGESLQMIARKFRVTIPELIRANHLRHPDQIAPGTRLVIPSATPAPPVK